MNCLSVCLSVCLRAATAVQQATAVEATAVEATAVRIVDACINKVHAVQSKTGLFRRAQALLRDIKTVATSGSKDDMVR